MAYYIAESSHRFYAKLIDQVIILFFSIPVFVSAFRQIDENGIVVLHWSYVLYYFLLSLCYDFVSYYFFAQTPGKWVFDLTLVDSRNPQKELDHWQILIRLFATRLEFFFSWAIYAVAFFRYDRRHLADLIAGTRVSAVNRRQRPAKIRWIQGGLILLLSISQGPMVAYEKLKNVHFENSNFYMSLSGEDMEEDG